MAKEFSKAGRQITIAVKETGIGDPDLNVKLKRAIQNAKSVQMPKDRIEAAIKKALGNDTADYKEMVYEGMAPHGIAIVVETATDNYNRTAGNVRAVFTKKNGSLGTQGMHDFLFDRKGVFLITNDKVADLEELELQLIDFGLEEIALSEEEGEEKLYRIVVDFNDFGTMQDGLDQLNFETEKTRLERIPKHTKELNEDQLDEVLAIIDLLEEDDDVQNVFHNLA
ncbi:UNVERIFIED_CONTAM: hypothetical protein GTU68_010206 [Idotea baltica]|nr:hypothetical protein [Idotea baltica]